VSSSITGAPELTRAPLGGVGNHRERQLALLFLAILASACASVVVPPNTVTPAGVAPDTIPCSRPLLVKESNEPNGIRAEYDWLHAHYPNHGSLSHGLAGDGKKQFDVFMFTTQDGQNALVCFDITLYLGHW